MSAALRNWWTARDARERSLLALALLVLGLALAWSVALSPALRVLRGHAQRVAQLEQQLTQMQQWQLQAQGLKALARPAPGAAPRALDEASKRLLGRQSHWDIRTGTASFTLRAVPAQALAQWLAAVRSDARARVLQARLQRSEQGWSGTVQVALPE
ncbi:MAG: type II secretion system protein GspM [Rhodoferax sp.]